MTLLPRNNLLSWRIFGNAIHECHALVGLITAWNFKKYEHSQPQLPMKDLLLRHQSRCWVANQLTVEEDPDVPGLLYVSHMEHSASNSTKRTEPFTEAEVAVDHKRIKLEPKTEHNQSTTTPGFDEVFQPDVQEAARHVFPLLSKEEQDFSRERLSEGFF